MSLLERDLDAARADLVTMINRAGPEAIAAALYDLTKIAQPEAGSGA